MMKQVGFICDITEDFNRCPVIGAARIMRAVPLAKALDKLGISLFIYSPKHVNPKTKVVAGFQIIDNQFLPVTSTIPDFNGNWFLGNIRTPDRSGMSYKSFSEWATGNGIKIYPDYEFENMSLDKYKTFGLVNHFDANLQPDTELYDHSAKVLKHFLEKHDTVFLKPRYGSRGNKIAVIKKNKSGYIFTYYKNKEAIVKFVKDLSELHGETDRHIREKNYIIQEGLKVKSVDESTFIIRCVMIDDGKQWYAFSKAVLSPSGQDIANTEQNGMNVTVEDLFNTIYPKEQAQYQLEYLEKTAVDLARFLDGHYPKKLMEMAFDFIVDENDKIYLAEMDVRPGMIKPGMDTATPFKDLFHPTPAEQLLYDKYVQPHAQYLANFFDLKLRSA